MRKITSALFLLMTVIITTGAGYVGTLPNVEAEFDYLRKESSENAQAPYSVEELDKQNEEKLKPVPRENENYVDIIIKKDGTTDYLKDVNAVILILEKLRKCLNTDRNIQKFNAIVSNLIDNVAYITNEYKGRPESNYLSYNRLNILSAQARDVANFRMNAQKYQSYIPYTSSENIYTKENIDAKMEALLVNVNETIFILKNLE